VVDTPLFAPKWLDIVISAGSFKKMATGISSTSDNGGVTSVNTCRRMEPLSVDECQMSATLRTAVIKPRAALTTTKS